jgi:hypothetical protein
MKSLIGFTFAVTTMVLLTLVNMYTDDFIPDFLCGWISCMAFVGGRATYTYIKEKDA